MLIYGCKISTDDLTSIDCPDTLYHSVKLNSKIIAFTYWK